MLQGMGAGAAIAAMSGQMGNAWADQAMRRQAGFLNLNLPPDPSKPIGTDRLPQIQNIVIYMQENHSFDNYFGTLDRHDGTTVDGFTMGPDGLPTNSNPDLLGNPFVVTHNTTYCDDTPKTSQSWNASHISYNNGAMDGFIRAGRSTTGRGATGAMSYYTEDDLPFYHELASTFPICDKWFCSVLAQTYPNRRYLQAATSVGIVSTDVNEVLAFPDAPNGLIWDRLDDNGITWKDYVIDIADIMLFPNFYLDNKSQVFTFDKFLYDAAAGTLPQVSIISPGATAYSEEPSNDVQLGEAYSSSIINAVMHGPQWPNTAMFFMWDEHGGYYDHVPPPPAVAPDAIGPHINVPPDQPGAFDQYGMRVPGIVISPFAKAKYVSHLVHDHTSVLKFIETKWNLAPLTYRDAAADDLLDCFDFANPGFMDPPELPAPGVPATGSTCSAIPLPATVSSIPPPPTTTTTTSTSTTSTTVEPTTTTSTSTTVASTTAPTSGASSVPPTSGQPSVLPSSLAGLAATLSAAEREPTVRFGSDTGDGAPTGPLPTTGSPVDRLGTAGAVVAVGGAALVLAAREATRRARTGLDPQTPSQ